MVLRLALPGVLIAAASLVAAGPAAPTGGATKPKPPTAAVCVPKTIRMEFFSSLGGKLGEYDARFDRLVKVYANDPYSYKCLWVGTGPNDETFVVFINNIPAGIPGRIASGNCDGTRKDSYPFYSSRKRHLGVSGGERKYFQNALGGNAKILKGVLAAAEAAGVGLPCQGAKPKPPPPPSSPPPPKPKPKPTPGSGQLAIDYSLNDRFGSLGDNGIMDYDDTPIEVYPGTWKVNFDVTRRDGKTCAGALAVEAPGSKQVGFETEECQFYALYPEEAKYAIKVKLVAGGKTLVGSRTFVLQDWLIVGLGDSNGSGEGAPDLPAQGKRGAVWQNPQCHRSGNSYQAQTARAIERRNTKTSVTFVHVACSGASIVNGILGSYEGIEPGRGPVLRPQVSELATVARGREVDAVIISIGVNDLRFGALVAHCILKIDCPNAKFPTKGSPRTLAQEMQRLLGELPVYYKQLARSLRAIRIPASRVYLSEYFDSTKNDAGVTCTPNLITTPAGSFTRDEAQFAHDDVLVPLNKAVAAAGKANTIRGAYATFGEHGYCAVDSWIVPLTRSFFNQRNKEGTLHSTTFGNTKQAEFAVPEIEADFYKGGRTRAPKR